MNEELLTCMYGQSFHFEQQHVQSSILVMVQNYHDQFGGLLKFPHFYATQNEFNNNKKFIY